MKIEVVMRKEMDLEAYKQMRASAIQKGWKIDAYQLGYFSEGNKTKIEP